jgi:hypothetical protein
MQYFTFEPANEVKDLCTIVTPPASFVTGSPSRTILWLLVPAPPFTTQVLNIPLIVSLELLR